MSQIRLSQLLPSSGMHVSLLYLSIDILSISGATIKCPGDGLYLPIGEGGGGHDGHRLY